MLKIHLLHFNLFVLWKGARITTCIERSEYNMWDLELKLLKLPEAVCILCLVSPFSIFKVNSVPSSSISFFIFASAVTPSSETLIHKDIDTHWWPYRAQVENSGYAPDSKS